MFAKCITHTVLKHTWQRQGQAIQARFCCWTHQCKPRVTPLERKPGEGAAPDLWMCRIWGRDRGQAMGKVTQLPGGCYGEQLQPPAPLSVLLFGCVMVRVMQWETFVQCGVVSAFWSIFCMYLYRNPSRPWNWAMDQCYSEPFVFPATNTPELCSPGLWPKLLHPRPYCPISSNNIPSSVYKQTLSEEVHGKKS